MLLCKRFRQKFTIYFIMISDKKTVICTVQFWLTFFVLKSGKLGPKVLYFFTYADSNECFILLKYFDLRIWETTQF